jgi:hypothetical protein
VAVSKMIVSPDIKRRLGGGVEEVGGWLWAVDCQACGKPLGDRPPALSVDDMMTFAAASLAHQRCRPSAWRDGPFGVGGDWVSHRSRLVMLPLVTDGEPESRPMPAILVNPTMEMVMLGQQAGRWHPQFHATFSAIGMRPPGPELQIRRPLRGATARLNGAVIRVTLPQPALEDGYECSLVPGDEAFRRAIADQSGIMLAVTHAADPWSADLASQFAAVLRSRQILLGWAPLTTA